MQIVFATSPHVRHAAVLQSDFRPDPSVMYSFAPVGLLALSAVLRQELRIEPLLFDTNKAIVTGSIPLDAAFYRSAAERICESSPDMLGFMTECDSYHHVLQIMEQVKQLRPSCQCVLGGPHATAVARQTMERRRFVDAIVLGEGEQTLPELVRACRDGDHGPIAGTLRRGARGEVLDGGARPLASSLDALPIPAYDLYPGTPYEEIFVEAGRGCPFQCTFCSTAPFWQRKHRVKSPARILEEIRLVQQLYQSKRVHFTHDLLTTDRRWVGDLCRTLINAGVPVRWTCSARTDTVDRELLELMAAAGCNAIYFGIESGSARVLKEIKKETPIDESIDILRLCRDVGIRPNAGFIAGLPSEDRDSLRDTFIAFERALELGTRPTHIFGFCPFVSSQMFSSLDTLSCDGHFLDLPIEPDVDAANRAMVIDDPSLFASYHRPRLDVGSTRLQGVDEFSCLVEPLALPVLRLSRMVGGMLEVFDRWTAFVERHNRENGAGAHRLFYGSPLSFSLFVAEELRATTAADDPMLQFATVMSTSFDLARQWASEPPPTTMANHRSVDTPDVGRPIQPGDALRLRAPLATMKLDYDVTVLLDASPDDAPDPPRRPTYLLWDLTGGSRIRLSQIDPFLYAALEKLKDGPQPVAALMMDWVERGELLDYERVMRVLTEANTFHLVETA